MLTIHMAGFDPDDSAGMFFYDGTIPELFRRVSVQGGQVVFVEISKGHLLNLAEVLRIEDDEPELTTEEAAAALEDEQDRGPVVHYGTQGATHMGPQADCRICPVEQAQPSW